jgi:protein-disulfide isomerase/uncharacterized membrane protein
MFASKESKLVFLALSSSLMAIAVHIYLSIHYYDIQLGTSSGSAICNVSSTLNCDAVAASSYSSVFGLPVSILGISSNAVLFLFILIASLGLTSDKQKIYRFAFYLSSMIAFASVVMGTIAALKLAVYCLFCIVAYILSFINWAALLRLQSKNPFHNLGENLLSLAQDFRWAGISLVLIIPMSLLFHNMWLDTKGGKNLEPLFADYYQAWLATSPISFSNDGIVKGSENPVMTIVEFADFKCPHCKSAAPSLKAFTSSHTDVRLIFKAFPLDGACNANPQMPQGDGISCRLAKAVYCGDKLAKKGWELYEDFFEAQEDLRNPSSSPEHFSKILSKHQLAENDIQSCIKEEETHKAIINQSQEGVNAQIEGTPSIFVNGKKLKLGHTVSMLEKVYASLKQQK